MADKTKIANLALSHIRDQGTVENIETEVTPEALNANLWYDEARLQAIADFDFGFARKRLTLGAHEVDPPAEWAFRFQFPADLVQPRYIENPSGRGKPPILFDIELATDAQSQDTMSILTNQEAAVLVYSKDVTSTTFFPPHFVLSISYLLAHFIAGPLTGKKSIQDKMIENYNNAINVAGAHEANVTAAGTEGAPLPDWLENR